MAVDQAHDSEIWLPSQFLTDGDIISEKQHIWQISKGFGSCGSSSDLSSPVDSEMGSTETETEEEDYIIAELTRRMAHHMLQENDKHTKSWGALTGSPQSTPWSALGLNPAIPKEPFKPTPSLARAKNPTVWTHSNEVLTYDQLQAIRFFQLKQQQLIKQRGTAYTERRAETTQHLEPKQQLQQMKYRGRPNGVFGDRRNIGSLGLSSSPLQQQQNQLAGSGMRAIFLTGSGSRTGSCGTGVFLPPGIVNSSDSRKKPGCSTALIPTRVLQALEFHFENMDAISRYNAPSFPPRQHGASMGGNNNNGLFSQQKRHTRNGICRE